MKRMMIVMGAAMLIAAGCQTTTIPPQVAGTRTIDPATENLGKPSEATMYDLESCAQRLVSKMSANANFAEIYKEFKTKYNRRPYIVVNAIKNMTTSKGAKGDLFSRLLAVRNSINASLFDSGLFRVYDDEATDEILARITNSADGGLEKINLNEWTGNATPPDYLMRGEFRHFEDVGGYHLYKLVLTIHDVRTRELVWTGVQTHIKQ